MVVSKVHTLFVLSLHMWIRATCPIACRMSHVHVHEVCACACACPCACACACACRMCMWSTIFEDAALARGWQVVCWYLPRRMPAAHAAASALAPASRPLAPGPSVTDRCARWALKYKTLSFPPPEEPVPGKWWGLAAGGAGEVVGAAAGHGAVRKVHISGRPQKEMGKNNPPEPDFEQPAHSTEWSGRAAGRPASRPDFSGGPLAVAARPGQPRRKTGRPPRENRLADRIFRAAQPDLGGRPAGFGGSTSRFWGVGRPALGGRPAGSAGRPAAHHLRFNHHLVPGTGSYSFIFRKKKSTEKSASIQS